MVRTEGFVLLIVVPAVVTSLLCGPCLGSGACRDVTRGVYGVPSVRSVAPGTYMPLVERGRVGTVFVPPEQETVSWFVQKGFKVFLSVNAFGGKDAWKVHPDSRPVTADGVALGSGPGYRGHGGVCPSHPGWRQGRLDHISRLIRQFGGPGGCHGIWLDFIRYPGLWESERPEIPDTCYCPRCLGSFQEVSGVHIPKGLDARGAALWIKDNARVPWTRWRQEQVSSFVAEVREVVSGDRQGVEPLILGLFLVPWTKGERENAVSYLLGQDAFALSRMADVISPMVYHRMCGREPSWVGYLTRYYKETAACRVWPIVQAEDCDPGELGQVMGAAARACADGVLVYSFGKMGRDKWASFDAFTPPPNLVSRVGGIMEQGSGPAASIGGKGAAQWSCPLRDGKPGACYLFSADFFRDRWENRVYPQVSVWGRPYEVNTHWLTGVDQPVRWTVTCPEKVLDPFLRFSTDQEAQTFQIRRPSLRKHTAFPPEPEIPSTGLFFEDGLFPVGIYGAGKQDLSRIKSLALNTVLLSGRGDALEETIRTCGEVGLRYVLSVPRDPDLVPVYLDEIAPHVRARDMAFYVNDEPGIQSFPTNRAEDINRLLKERFPGAATCMAVVRPQVCGNYAHAADFFMLDQYPVPFMPMTWLSDCMDQCAAGLAGDLGQRGKGAKGRLATVVQAFGGKRWATVGWPRAPTWQEMDCLAFLSIVHGSRGIFFYTFSEIGRTEESRAGLGRVVGRLNQVYPWLAQENAPVALSVEMLSRNRFDPQGRPAVHCCLKDKGHESLLITVNAIGTYVEANISPAGRQEGWKGRRKAREVFSGQDHLVVEGRIRVKLGPYETKAFVFSG